MNIENLREVVEMLFDSTIESGVQFYTRPNSLVTIRPNALNITGESVVYVTNLSRIITAQQVLWGLRHAREGFGDDDAAQRLLDQTIGIYALWYVIGSFHWQPGANAADMSSILMTEPYDTGAFGFTAEECRIIGDTISKLAQQRVPDVNKIHEALPTVAWMLGSKLRTYDDDAKVLAEIIAANPDLDQKES